MSPASPSSKSASSKGKAGKAAAAAATAKNGASPVDMARELAAIVESHTLSELILETAGVTLTIRRGVASGAMHAPTHAPAQGVHHAPLPAHAVHAPAPTASAAPTPAAAPVVDDKRHTVTSPFVGTFYRSPSPEADPYVREGQKVEKGQVLCIVEAMKLMNEIEADVGGVVTDVLVENGKTVEYGQALFKITPA